MAEPSPSPGDSLIGRTVAGRYRVISKLGEGGMGLTYRAWDEAEGRPVVLKMPRRNLVENAAFLERFSREVRMMAALSHPSIVPILDVGEDDGLPILVMRFLPGGSLSNRRLRDAEGKVQPMQPSTLQLWLPAVASALDFVHANGIVHRDVKPANIFFDAFWGAYLGDFGIAKIVEDTTVLEKEHTLTATSMAIGTQEYMAPEQFTPKSVVDGRVDQYALAVMVYEILVGQRPFRGETAHLVVEVTTQPVPRLTQFRRDLPDSVCQAVYRGLSKQPGERFASCAEFAQAVLRDVRPMADDEGVARLLCPQCGNMLKMPTSAAGRQGKCPRCKTEMMVAEDLGALWLAREEHEGAEPGAAGQESSLDSIDVFTSISNTTPVPKAGVRGMWSQLDPTVRRLGIGAGMLASLVATALLAGDYAARAARKQLDAATARQQKLVTENERLEKKVAELNDANLTLKEAVENLAAEKKQLAEKLAAGSTGSEGTKEVATVAAGSSPQSAPAQVKAVTNSIGIEFVKIPAGKFQMGEGPSAVAVTLTRPFLLGKTEVTRGQWEQVMGTTPWPAEPADVNLPASHVNWEDAREFCEKLTARERSSGKLQESELYRLPTEAEWEYACRAGATTTFSFGDDEKLLGDFAWFTGNSENKGHLVGTKQPNLWGLHDMHSNVYEWCSDWYDGTLAGGVDPVGSAGGSLRVRRGGSWRKSPVYCRSASRFSFSPANGVDDLGFRLALSPSGAESPEAGTDQGSKVINPSEGSTPTAGNASVSTPASEAAALNLPEMIASTVGIKLTLIPAGTFTMGDAGSSNEKPHRVTLTRPFYVGVHEVTNAQWKRVIGSVPSKWKDDDLPVEQVSLDDAVEFCRKLSALPAERKAGRVYRLPTEAEWEYACRAGTTTKFSFGDDEKLLGEYGWFDGNSNKQTHPVGQKKPNAWGLYDMHGNVLEWCGDWVGDYPDEAGTNPQGPSSGSYRVNRGGSWYNADWTCWSAFRFRRDPSDHRNNLGFRLALSPSGAESPEAGTYQGTKTIAPPEGSTTAAVIASGSTPASAAAALNLPETITSTVGIKLKLIPAGTFTMGEAGSSNESNEKPHRVTLTRPFYMGVHEVTNAQWKQVMGSVPSQRKDDDLPVEQVSWDDTVEFCRKLSAVPEERRAGRVYRLPTEAEWEYACRAGTTMKYSFGDDETLLGDYGWFTDNSARQTHPVGQKKPNAWGLYDMHGNVWEWCSDWHGQYPDGVVTNPQGPSSGSLRVRRGGGWISAAWDCRSADRAGIIPSYRGSYLGIRLALSPSAAESPEAGK